MNAVFTDDKVTDQKRFVRGEQLLLARKALRVRDRTHNKKWRVFMLPGRDPGQEIAAIRELMPLSDITAVDRDEMSLLSAIDFGANEVVKCQLEDFGKKLIGPRPGNYHVYPCVSNRTTPAPEIAALDKFDLVILDLCSNVNETTKRIASVYRGILALQGVMIFNFSYGRDVVEVFQDAKERSLYSPGVMEISKKFSEAGVPDALVGRLLFLFTKRVIDCMRSVMIYKGAQMPMCSVLIDYGWVGAPLSYVQCEPGDFEIAVTCPDPALMYACPQERIESLRRKHAAIKASYTRKLRVTK